MERGREEGREERERERERERDGGGVMMTKIQTQMHAVSHVCDQLRGFME